MAHYLPVAPDKVAAWEDYRNRFYAHHDAARALVSEIGGRRFKLGFGGSVVAVEFEGEPHLAFSGKPKTDGSRIVLSRGRSTAQKEAIAWMEERNKQLRDLVPAAHKVAQEHGFLLHLGYEYDSTIAGETSRAKGNSALGNPFNPVQGLWAGRDAQVIVYAADVQGEIDRMRNDPYYTGKNLVLTPESFETPEGYERITEARYNFITAEYELKKETEKK